MTDEEFTKLLEEHAAPLKVRKALNEHDLDFTSFKNVPCGKQFVSMYNSRFSTSSPSRFMLIPAHPVPGEEASLENPDLIASLGAFIC